MLKYEMEKYSEATTCMIIEECALLLQDVWRIESALLHA